MKDPNTIYKAVIVGLGFIGAGDQVSGDAIGGQQVKSLDGTHYDAFVRNKRLKVVAGSSRDAGRRERFERKSGCKTYADWRKMIENEKPDIVGVATYAPQHAEITVACAQQGVRAVYCEKPIATKLADAEQMVSACDKAGAILAINHNRRFNSNYRRLRDLIAAGKLGDLTTASLRWGGGRLGNVGTHTIDALRMVTGRNVLGVSGTLDLSRKPDVRGPAFQDPGAFGWMRMEGGLMAALDAADYGKGGAEITVNGTLGRAITGGLGVRFEYWDGKTDQWANPTDVTTSMDRAVAEIVDALDGKSPFPYAGIEGMRTFEAIVAFHASHAKNSAWVDLPLKGGDRAIEVLSG